MGDTHFILILHAQVSQNVSAQPLQRLSTRVRKESVSFCQAKEADSLTQYVRAVSGARPSALLTALPDLE